MQKSFKIATLAGALTMAISGVVSAANHDLQFGGWTVSKGQIDESTAGVCASANYDCQVVATGSGFKQIQVSPSATNSSLQTGESYIMTIVTDQNADGSYGAGDLGFYDVSFIRMVVSQGGASSTVNENGIFSEQKISEVTTQGTGSQTAFDSTTNISTGWATAAASPVSISQSLLDAGDTATNGDNFSSNFKYGSNNDATGVRTGFEMSIDQIAGLASAGKAETANDVQAFALREKQGTKLNSGAGSVSLGTGNTVSWADGNDIKAIWVGQSINLDSVPGNGSTTGTSLGSTFGYMSFDNLSDSAAPITQFGFAASNATSAWVWDPAFNIGTSGKPCLADPSGDPNKCK